MAQKLSKESLIAVELSRLDEKIKEFQDYLEKNTIITKVKDNKLKEADDTNRHKEIDTQIKMINALFIWLPSLDKLRDVDDTKKFEARGGAETNGLFDANKKL
jgi:hypothetical protein